jgi:hypothetical protein
MEAVLVGETRPQFLSEAQHFQSDLGVTMGRLSARVSEQKR